MGRTFVKRARLIPDQRGGGAEAWSVLNETLVRAFGGPETMDVAHDMVGGKLGLVARLVDATVAVARTDAWAARAVLKVLRSQESQLRPAIDGAYLEQRFMPAQLSKKIASCVAEAEARLEDLLRHTSPGSADAAAR